MADDARQPRPDLTRRPPPMSGASDPPSALPDPCSSKSQTVGFSSPSATAAATPSRREIGSSGAGGKRRYVWGRKDEEYLADFILVSRRTLTDEEYRLFKFHVLLGADWKLCTRQLKMDRGRFFNAIYRMQEKLGKVFSELQPFALYPVDEYFGAYRMFDASVQPPPPAVPTAAQPGSVRRDNVVAFPPKPVSASFPLKKAA